MTKDKYIFLKLGLLICLGFIMISLFNVYNQIFNLKLISILIISYLVFTIGVIYNDKISFLGYLIALITILFYRKKIDDNISDSNYINIWINHLFSNKIIFINVFGNLILYIPLIYYIIKFSKKILLSISIVFSCIIIGEYVQYLLKIGVFDLVDIVINTMGVLMYVLMYEVYIWMKKIKTKQIQNL